VRTTHTCQRLESSIFLSVSLQETLGIVRQTDVVVTEHSDVTVFHYPVNARFLIRYLLAAIYEPLNTVCQIICTLFDRISR